VSPLSPRGLRPLCNAVSEVRGTLRLSSLSKPRIRMPLPSELVFLLLFFKIEGVSAGHARLPFKVYVTWSCRPWKLVVSIFLPSCTCKKIEVYLFSVPGPFHRHMSWVY